MDINHAANEVENKLKITDKVARDYYSLMRVYFPLPSFEDIILDRLEDKYDNSIVNGFLDICSSYGLDQEQEKQEDEHERENDEEDFEEFLKDLPSGKSEELIKKEEKFQNLSNLMCSMTGSVALTVCNIFSSTILENNTQDMINILTLTAMAHLSSGQAIAELFPNREFAESIAYAKRSQNNLKNAQNLLEKCIINSSPAIGPMLEPAKSLFQQASQAVDNFITETIKLANEDFDTPF
ncbi:MAG: hypothetical protein J6X55_18290 [Victivallales bacterium]|nr:hypothetical protein [Victivallales bacterium]